VGAGVLGASAAYHLACAGARVTIIDPLMEGRATAAGAGIICPWVSGADDAAFYRLYTAGAQYYAELVPALAAIGQHDLGFRRTGALVVSADASELAFIENLLRERQAATPEMGAIRRLTSPQARVLFPPLHAKLGAVHIAGGARVDGRRLAAALLRAAQHHGATVRDGAATLRLSGRRVQVVVDGEHLPADHVILTAGVWATALLRPLGIDLSIHPARGQIVHLRAGQPTQDWPVIFPLSGHYLLAFDDQRVVVGATREDAGFACQVTAAGLAEVLTQALNVAPGLASAEVIETRVGLRPVAPGRPLLGALPGLPGLLIGNGLGAAGLTIGPLAGRLLADLALGHALMLDMAPYAASG
jgi:D-amino-acid dehydrogenase